MPVDRPLFVDSAGRLLLNASGQLGCCCPSAEGVFTFDLIVEPESYYDITVENPFAFTLTRGQFFAGTGVQFSVLWGAEGAGGTPVNFDGEGTTPIADVDLDITCSQAVPALGFVQINIILIADVTSTSFEGSLHYTRP